MENQEKKRKEQESSGGNVFQSGLAFTIVPHVDLPAQALQSLCIRLNCIILKSFRVAEMCNYIGLSLKASLFVMEQCSVDWKALLSLAIIECFHVLVDKKWSL